MEIGAEHKWIFQNPLGQGGGFRLPGLGAQQIDMMLVQAIGKVAVQIDAGSIAASHIIWQ